MTHAGERKEDLVDCTLEVVVLPVSDIDASVAFYRDARTARQELLDRGVECSEIVVFSPDDGGTFFGFSDPDGNTWAVQELKVRAEKPLIPVDHRGRSGA